MRLLSVAIPLPPLDIFPDRRPRKSRKAKAKTAAVPKAAAAKAMARSAAPAPAPARPRGPAQRARRLSAALPRMPRLPRLPHLPRLNSRLAGLALTAVMLSGLTSWALASGVLTGGPAVLLEATARAGLAVDRISVVGRDRTDAGAILATLGVSRGAPLLGVDVAAAREALEALPWVKSAVVARRLPDTLHVTIEERRPVALWQRAPGEYVLTDAEGAPIVVGDIARWSELPVILGAGAPETAMELFSVLRTAPDVAGRVKAATRLGDRRWDVLLDDFEHGLTVKLPATGAAVAWARFAEVERSHGISQNNVSVVDMRLTDRLIVRLNGDGLPIGDKRKGGPDLRQALPLPAGAGTEA